MTFLLLVLLAQDPGGARLAAALQAAQRELAAEQERIRREDAAQEAELAEAKARLAALSDEIVDRTLALAAKEKALEEQRNARAELRRREDAARVRWAGVRTAAADAAQKLDDFLSALPPGERRAEQRAAVGALKAELDADRPNGFDLGGLFAAGAALLAESRSIAIFPHTVRTAAGLEEPAEILRAGMIFAAYRTKASGRMGEVLAAPREGEGYRWTEALPPFAVEDLTLLFAGGAAEGASMHLPLDVTQRLSPDRRENGSNLLATLKAGGLVMFPLGLTALFACMAILERFLTLFVRTRGSERAARAVLACCRRGEWDDAERRARAGRGVVLRTLAAALGAREAGRKGMEEAVLAAVLKETPALERFLAMLAVLAGVAPLLGLLGTVMGMIATFDVIRVFGSGEPGLMAGGISEALVATATGLVIAIPILVFHSVFAGRADRILADVQRHGSSLVDIACAAEDNGFASEALAPISSRAPLSVPGGAGAPRQ